MPTLEKVKIFKRAIPDATQSKVKIQTFSIIAITFEPMKKFILIVSLMT